MYCLTCHAQLEPGDRRCWHCGRKTRPLLYPGALYALRRQGNVVLRLYVDSTGQTVPDSTRLEEKSGFPAFDSAAIAGARDLRFIPAKLHGEPMGMTILFPVYFRHPEAPPLQGDTALKKSGRG